MFSIHKYRWLFFINNYVASRTEHVPKIYLATVEIGRIMPEDGIGYGKKQNSNSDGANIGRGSN